MMKANHGFTLVELAIVLVIIGMLVGGILVAQSMIQTARISSFVRQIQQIDAGVANFKTQFGTVPGDASALGCSTGSCDDGRITSASNAYQFNQEVANFWVQLQKGGFATGQPTFTSTVSTYITNSGTSPNILQSVLSKSSGIVASVDGFSSFAPSASSNVYSLADYSLASVNVYDGIGYALTPLQALAIDKKMDDGVANAGNVMAMMGGYVASSYPVSKPAVLGTCVTAGSLADYKSTTDLECNLMIKMLSQTAPGY